jgi:hypothetical protein
LLRARAARALGRPLSRGPEPAMLGASPAAAAAAGRECMPLIHRPAAESSQAVHTKTRVAPERFAGLAAWIL